MPKYFTIIRKIPSIGYRQNDKHTRIFVGYLKRIYDNNEVKRINSNLQNSFHPATRNRYRAELSKPLYVGIG